jgi:putative phosphoesterase
LFFAPAHFVFGNVDRDEDELRNAIAEAGHQCHERFGALEISGVRIALLHGDDTRRLASAIGTENWDLVCCGHTHRSESRFIGKTLLLNPGAVYRATPHSVATIELEERRVEFLEF